MEVSKQAISVTTEKNIILGCLVDDKFAKRIFSMVRKEHFQVKHYATVYSWCKEYFEQYKKVPGMHIQDLFNYHATKMRSEVAELIEVFLENISSEYEEAEDINWEYIYDKAHEFVKKRNLQLLTDEINGDILKDRLTDAEQKIRKYHEVVKETSKWVDPFNDEDLLKRLINKEDGGLFRFPGQLGDVIGDFQRSWFISWIAPMKRGKTFFLTECAIEALVAKRKVAFISLEMEDVDMAKRIIQRVTATADEEGWQDMPVWDCKKNQEGTCQKPERTQQCALYDGIVCEDKPMFDPSMEYRPCTFCKDAGGHHTKDYEMDSWFKRVYKESYVTKIKDVKRKYGKYWSAGRFRMLTFPRFGASLQDVENALDELESTENFIPDVLILDYADILSNQGLDSKDPRHQLDQIWKTLAGIASKRKICLISASQSNRSSMSSKQVKLWDVAEDIRKIAHINVALTISQEESEFEQKRSRVTVATHRHNGNCIGREVTVLQHLDTGQVVLDSYEEKANAQMIQNRENEKNTDIFDEGE